MSASDLIVVFGASGDLTARKLVPALYDDFRKQQLPPATQLVGVSRTPMGDEEFRAHLLTAARETLGRDFDPAGWARFAACLHYCPGDVSTAADFARLEGALRRIEGANAGGRLYYLALAPQLYAPVATQLGAAGMAHSANGWRRLVVEKPFGRDLASARELNRQLHAVFDESQIYRIDHYLGKETVQNLLALRFANTIFEPVWNRNFIDHVQITMAETVPVGRRGAYYDSAGVLRDMFQNHLLQVLTLVAMEPPTRYEANALRDEKVKVLHAIRTPQPTDVASDSVLAQYAGYRDEPGVERGSRTPTFAAARLNVDNWRWQGVPFYLRSGKALGGKTTEVIIQFVCPPHMIFDIPKGQTLQCNQLVMTLQPDEGIHLSFQTKVPEGGMRLRESKLYFHYRDSYPLTPLPEAYGRLLLDALHGDPSLFIRTDEIERAWEIVDPLIEGWSAGDGPLPTYAAGSWGPPEADAFMTREGRRWVNGASLHHEA